ncbi:MAG: hypothetical protein OEQ24_09485 [Gammaproteobacteria bacterium]|nr:hypothetical protein [Gammaproteobacteria bacterium]
MASFEIAEGITGASEGGGYSDVKGDRGGETYSSIARNKNPHWPGWKLIDDYKHSALFPHNINAELLRPLVVDFLRSDFWNRIKGDYIKEQQLANIVYDVAVNMGTSASAKNLQRALNSMNVMEKDWPDLKVDGAIGRKTLGAIDDLVRVRELRAYPTLILAFYAQAIVSWLRQTQTKESQEKFMNGWLWRGVMNVYKVAIFYFKKADNIRL